MMREPERIVLVGPSGAGKSSLARALAAALGFDAVDLDDLIVARADMEIAELFRRFGEPAFRAIESQVVDEVASRQRVVIATGGGAPAAARNRAAWRPGGVVIGLSATPETLVERVRRQATNAGGAERPLLAGDAVARMRGMLAERATAYGDVDAVIDTERRSLDETLNEALRIIRELKASGAFPRLALLTPVERSDIYVATGLLADLGTIVRRRWPRAGRVWLISDDHVAERWGERVEALLRGAAFDARALTIEAGEGSKRPAVVEELCRAMTDGGVTRRDVVVALGGGVVGDVAGFVASVCLRGLPLAQVPTSLLAMVDSSVGGKTGVNMPAGKNLVGAFYQPGVVLIDPDLLGTLPTAEYRSGLGEVVKHALIQRSTPLGGSDLLERLNTTTLDPVPASEIEEILATNVAIKRSVVQADERESGLRMILNFGHTAGHAIEADGYRYRHGEAVGLGMLVATRIAELLGRADALKVAEVEALVARAGLPTRVEGSVEAVIGRLSHDKKNVDGALHWILPDADGRVEPVTGVPVDVVRDALRATGAR